MSKRKKKRWVSDDDTTDFNENWLLDFALSNTGEHGLANTLDEIEEWGLCLTHPKRRPPKPPTFPVGGSDPHRHAPRRGAFVPDEGALIDSVAKQGGGFAEIFAVRFLGRVRGLRNAISQGDNEMAIVCAMALGAIGTELSMTQHWHLAESIYEGSRKGEAEAAQGRVPYAKLRELYAKEMAAGAKRKQAYAAVAKKTNVNPRTVQRAVTGY